jgi:hypothetical protein
MKLRGISFRHAVEQLREGLPSLAAEGAVKCSTVRVLTAPVAFDTDDQALLNQTVQYYHERLLATSDAQAYLHSRGLDHPELVAHFRLGLSDRSLGLRLPAKTRKDGAEIRERLTRVGLYRESGHEHFNGSLVVPVFNESGDVMEVYGRKLLDNLRAGTPKHLYLPTREGRGRGVFNVAGLTKEVILCEALIDALTFWCAGWRSVTSAYGIEGFTLEHVEAINRLGVERVLIAFDRDDAGERGAAKVADMLMAQGVECWRIQFPKGMDANEYALKVQPAVKSLGVLIRKAVWLGKGAAPVRSGGEVEQVSAPAASASSSLPSLAAEPLDLPEPVSEEPKTEPKAELEGDMLRLVCGLRTWQVRGVPKMHPGVSLKLNVRVQAGEGIGLHVDSVDLYSARSRAVFVAQAAAELGADARDMGRELGRVLLAVEQAVEQREEEARSPKDVVPSMSEAEQGAALAWLRAPDLLARIAADFDACGLVGEAMNKLTAYLACVSRLLASPLAVVVQSSSAAGKTSLMDAVLGFMPAESRIRYSAMTGQSLYYMGQTDLKHRILALAEEEGATRASYALKLLQSDGELTMAATGKDPTTGNLVTQAYHVEGPVMLMLTTTAIEVDEELMNRCLVLTVDEGSEQTKAIHARQRERRTLSGMLAKERKQDIQKLHQHAQRLLKPLAVVNPYAEQLSFHAQHARARRDHEKYLTLIDTVALLHQHQRRTRRAACGERSIEYIEVTREDIEAAHGIAHEVLGRSLDELPPVTRKLLEVLSEYVAQQAQTHKTPREQVRFTRRQLREACGWGDTQLRVHLQRLLDLELLASERGGPGGQVRYTLCHEVAGGRTRLCGLIEPQQLRVPESMTAKSRGLESEYAGVVIDSCGSVAGMLRVEETDARPMVMGLGEKSRGLEKAYIEPEVASQVLSYTQMSA